MAKKGGKSSTCGKGTAQSRLNIAREYQDLAHSKSDAETGAVRNAVAGNAVLAGIAAADAICCIRLGERSTSPDHADAVALLTKVDPKLAQKLATLIGSKPISHYGENFVGIETLKSCLRAMDQLILAANELFIRHNSDNFPVT